MQRFDEREGQFVTENRLVSVSKPQVHAKVHQSDNSAIEVLRLVSLMKQEVARDPSVPAGRIKRKILDTELYGRIKDEGRLENILSAFPLKVETTLDYYKVSLVGKTAKRKYVKHSYSAD